jgi:integrase
VADEETLPTKLPSLEGEVIAPSSRQVGPVGAVNDVGPNYFGVSIRDSINAKRETVSDATIDSYERTVNRLEKMGFDTTSDLSTINNHQAMDEIIDRVLENKKEYTPNVKARLGSDVKALIEAHLPEGVANAVQSFEKKARTKTKTRLFDFTVQRAAKPLILPEFDVFSKAIHKGIMSIPDKETRVFALTKLLSGLRDTDISGIRIKPGEKGKEVAYLRSSTKTLASISNKGRPIDYNLGSNIYAILDDLRQDVVEAGKNKEKLFSKSPATMKKTIQDVVRNSLKEAGAEIIDTRGDKVIPFTLGALRKNIFDIIDEEEGLRVANQVLGHSVKDTGLNYYKPGRKGRIGNVASAMDTFFDVYAKEVGYDSPKNLLKVYGLEKASLTVPDTLNVNPSIANVQNTASNTTASLLGPAEDSEALAKRMETSATRIENAATRIKDVTPSTPSGIAAQTDELLEEPKPKREAGYKFLEELEKGVMTQDEVNNAVSLREAGDLDAYNNIKRNAVAQSKAIRKQALRSGLTKLAIGAATTAIGIGLTGGAKAAEVVLDVALDPTNMGGTPEDASTADLERGVATGESLPKSGSFWANEQELGNMQRELQGRKDSEMQGRQVMDTTPAGGFALQNAQNVKSTFQDEYRGYTGFIRN